MGISEARLRELAAEIVQQLAGMALPKRQHLRVAAMPSTPLSYSMDPITRASHIRVIKHHKQFYGLQILVDQACIGYGGINDLPDDAVMQLHKDLDRARECIADGISLEDAGLIRNCA